MTSYERIKDIIAFSVPLAVAVCTTALCGYLYLMGYTVPGELSAAAAASNGFIFRGPKA